MHSHLPFLQMSGNWIFWKSDIYLFLSFLFSLLLRINSKNYIIQNLSILPYNFCSLWELFLLVKIAYRIPDLENDAEDGLRTYLSFYFSCIRLLGMPTQPKAPNPIVTMAAASFRSRYQHPHCVLPHGLEWYCFLPFFFDNFNLHSRWNAQTVSTLSMNKDACQIVMLASVQETELNQRWGSLHMKCIWLLQLMHFVIGHNCRWKYCIYRKVIR